MKKRLIFTLVGILICQLLISQGYFEYMATRSSNDFDQIKADLDAYYVENDRGRGSGYKQYQRWLYTTKDAVGNDGQLMNKSSKSLATHRKFKKQLSVKAENRTQHGQWKTEGPNDYVQGNGWNGGVGRVNRLYFHPTQANTFFACTPAGGLWRTTNDGSTWTCLTDGLPRIGAAGLAINPNNPNLMYLLTGDNDENHNYSIGLLRSTDGGVSWSTSGLTFAANTSVQARKLLVHPTNFDILFVTSSEGIHRSVDGGDTWTIVRAGSHFDLEFQPGNPTRMYVTNFGNVFVSTNSGDLNSWSMVVDSDLPSFNTRIEIAVTPADSNYVYLLYGSSAGTGKYLGLYRSVDAGNDFSERSDSPNILGYEIAGDDNADQGVYDLALEVDPNDEDELFVGGINVWKSTNGGTDWTIKSYWKFTNNSTGYTHADIHEIQIQNSQVYIASDGGVFKSINGGDDWTDLSEGLVIMQPYNIDMESGLITCGTQDNGSNIWSIGSQTATHTLGADGFGCLIDHSNLQTIYQTTQSTIQRSTNGGSTFVNKDIPNVSSNSFDNLRMHPTNADTIYAETLNLYRSYNRGDTWFNTDCGLSPNEGCQAIDDPDVYYVIDADEVRHTTNLHAASPTWTDVTPINLPFQIADAMRCIAVAPDDSERIWLGFGNFVNNERVYMSTNGGSTWMNVSGSLPQVPINQIICEPGNGNGIYAGTDIGVFYRNDQLGDWIFYSTGLPVVPISDMDIEGGRLYVGTFGRGIWSSDLHGGCVSGIILTNQDNGTGEQIHQAQSFISSTQIIQGALGTDITYKAGDEITLSTGFHAKQNNLFEAILDGCN